MRWFKANRRGGSTLALIALALQFVVSITHTHMVLGGTRLRVSPVATAAVTFVGIEASLDAAGLPTDDGACDICATLNLTRTADAAATPAVAAPVLIAQPHPAAPAVGPAISPRRHPAQPRAPPIA